MADAKYFTTTKKGEMFELKQELNSDKKDRKKEALKRVIASMTVGKDVSPLFPDVINCMQTDNLELKKLVYLYLMNYAKAQPDMAIMAVNTFVKDCEDHNPLIRALAVRTMGCIRVEKIAEYLCEPLRRCLNDEDPYVRKTAAVCVAKLYDIDPILVEDQGFLDLLKDMLDDSNPMVVSNAVAALSEITETSPQLAQKYFTVDSNNINKLLLALNECTEWGQTFILDSIVNYNPKDEKEAQSITDRVVPRLSHANSGVVLSAIKVIMKLMEFMSQDNVTLQTLIKKMAPPLITLLSGEPEIQYVALRNINLIVQKRPEILENEIRAFFIKYNDPIYVKLEKLNIIIRLVNANNIGMVLSELKEYATEVDVDSVRKAVRAIGRCAIKVESAAEKCVSTLLDLIQTKVNYVVQEAIIVIKDIFRKYPNKYENIISVLCENLDSLDEPEARASIIWIIGEYAERIDNADELLRNFLDGFSDEANQVQLQLLTAIVKLFLRRPSNSQDLVQKILSLATQESDNPDLRDRGFIYWRLLSTDPAAAKKVILAERPLISEETDCLEKALLDELMCNISTLACVYHKPPQSFIEGLSGPRRKLIGHAVSKLSLEDEDQPVLDFEDNNYSTTKHIQQTYTFNQNTSDLLSFDSSFTQTTTVQTASSTNFHHQQQQQQQQPIQAQQMNQSSSFDLLGDSFTSLSTNDVSKTNQNFNQNSLIAGLESVFGSSSTKSSIVLPKSQWLVASKSKGLDMFGTFSNKNGTIYMEISLKNNALCQMNSFFMEINKNTFGLSLASPLNVAVLLPNQTLDISIALLTSGSRVPSENINDLQVAIKNNIDVFYFTCTVPLYVLIVDGPEIDKKTFLSQWKNLPDENESSQAIKGLALDTEKIIHQMKSSGAQLVAHRAAENMIYFGFYLSGNIPFLAEFSIDESLKSIQVSLKSSSPRVHQLLFVSIQQILSA